MSQLERFVLATITALAIPAQAAVIVVDSLHDEINADGDCSLREAIQAANSNQAVDGCAQGNSGGSDVVLVPLEGTINLGEQIQISEGVHITGSGADKLSWRLQAGSKPHSHVFVQMDNPAHDFALDEVEIVGSPAEEGAITVFGADRVDVRNVAFRDIGGSSLLVYRSPGVNSVNVDGCTFTNNRLTSVWTDTVTNVTIRNSRFIGNQSARRAGAVVIVRADGVVISDTLFARNRTVDGWDGGAIYVDQEANATPTISRWMNVTFADNHADSEHGDALVFGGPNSAFVTNSTFTRNGRPIYLAGADPITLRVAHTTIEESGHRTYVDSDPARNGLIVSEAAQDVRISRSLVFGKPPGGTLCAGVSNAGFSSGGLNRFESGDISCNAVATDSATANPNLLALAVYGDGVPVRLPQAGSQVVDFAGTTCFDAEGAALDQDARGFDRPLSATTPARCDAGAVERDPVSDDFLFVSGWDF